MAVVHDYAVFYFSAVDCGVVADAGVWSYVYVFFYDDFFPIIVGPRTSAPCLTTAFSSSVTLPWIEFLSSVFPLPGPSFDLR